MAFLLLASSATLALLLALPVGAALRAALLAYAFSQSARACQALVSARSLRIHRSGEIHVRGPLENWRTGVVRGGSFVLPWLTIVRWRAAGARLDSALVLLPGMASGEELRKIRVLLRWS